MAEESSREETKIKSEGRKGSSSKTEKVPFYKLFSFADKTDVILMIFGSLGAIIMGVSQPLMVYVFGQVINSLGTTPTSQVLHKVAQVGIRFLYLGAISSVGAFLQTLCWMVTGERQATRIRGLYLQTILRQDIAFFDTETATGEIIGRMSGDTILIQEAMGEKAGKFIQFASTFFGGFVVAFTKGWLLSLVLLSSMPAIAIAAGAISLMMAKMSGRSQLAYAQAGNVVEQTIGAIRTVASFTGEKLAIENYNSNLRLAYAAMVDQGLASGIGFGTLQLATFCTYGLAIWYGSKLILKNKYNGGDVIAVNFSLMMGGMALGQASPCLNSFAAGQAAAYKMFETVKRKPQIDAYDPSGIVLEDIKGEVELKNVHFKYPARPDVQIFSGFSLHIPSGAKLALVGQSGSGKSTIISLLERFYDPDSGEVCIDGVNLKSFQIKWIRGNMGLVSQEPTLFATSIKENITYGKENATDQDIRNAIELANAAKFIDKLPMGLDTLVGQHGTQLSGGQKQRIAIARAIIKNPKILLLDEATSALDAESERIVQGALAKVMLNRTTIIIAHRLTTVKDADTIAVLQSGKLVEKGTHDELIKDSMGAYWQLVHLQGGTKGEKVVDAKGKEIEKVDSSLEIDTMRKSLSRKRRSTSKGSSSSRLSFMSFGVPSILDFQENVVGEQYESTDHDGIASSNKANNVSLTRLAHLSKPEFLVLVLGSTAAAVNGVVFPIFGLLLATAINSFYQPAAILKKDSRHWALMYLILGFVTLVAQPVQGYLFGVAGGKLIQRVRSLTFDRVVHQEISWFDSPANSSGAVGARLSTDASAVRNLVGDTLALMVQNVTTLVAGFVISYVANAKLAGIVTVVLPLLLMQFYVQSKFLQGFSADAKLMYEEASQIANDAVSSIRTVASFCAENRMMKLYQKKCEVPRKQGIRLGIISGFGFGLSNAILYCSYSFCFYMGGLLVKRGEAKFGEVFKVFFALTMASLGVAQSTSILSSFKESKESAASIFEIINSKPTIDSNSDDGMSLENVKGDIEFQHVSFKYPTRPDVQIFKDLCLSIPSTKKVALVGESGSGKSTVISLIERFYDPDSGVILLDNIKLQKFNIKWLRKQMGLVSQEPVLFNETIRANIAYGRQEIVGTEEEIIEAAKAANAHNFISALPQGYDTSVGERGVQLSGGQKQRLAIARAILKNPKILLLDEATSALDTESERVVQDALDRVMVDRTTVIVAHRLTTIKGADIIAVVKNGVISEKGTHEELIALPNGGYASLVALQMQT